MSRIHHYNFLSPEEQEQRIIRKAEKQRKKIHRLRKRKIIIGFGVIFIIILFQLIMARIQTNKINNQVYSLKKELCTKQALHKKLKAESYDLKDLDYLLKVIRYKYYYSKPGEFIYNIQDKKDSN